MKRILKIDKKLITSLALAFFGIAFSKIALAAGGQSEELPPPILDFVLSKKTYWINFLVYFSIVYYLCARAFPKIWQNRREEYLNAIETGKRKLAESEAQLAKARIFYEEVPEKVLAIKESLQKQVEIDSEQIIEEAKIKVSKLDQAGNENLVAASRALHQEFKKDLIALAIDKAKNKAKNAASADVEQRLQSKVLDRVSNLIN
jgi:F0F1-type ATP synthase membrane subunit b/b'